jgi:hypothetical protein
MRKLFLGLMALVLLLPACARQSETKLIIQIPEQAKVGETVIIKVTDEAGRPVADTRLYYSYDIDYADKVVNGSGDLGQTDSKGELITFFVEQSTYSIANYAIADKKIVIQPGYATAKETIKITFGPIEFAALGGVKSTKLLPRAPLHRSTML